MIELRITPIGPARFGIRHLSTPAVASRDDVWIAPPPSTVLGALGALLGARVDCGRCGSGDFECRAAAAERSLLELADQLGVRKMWGPLVRAGGRIGVPALDFVLYPDSMTAERVEKVSRVGLALTENKTAAPGYLYRATFLRARGLTYIYYIDGDLGPFRPRVVRLGGEGRAALVEAVEVKERPPGVMPEAVSGHAVLITPLLMPDGELPRCVKPLGAYELKPAEEGGRAPAVRLERKVRVVQWGLGFSEACRERRPIYPALPPGTAVEAGDCPAAVGYMARLGYGALYPMRRALAPAEPP
ncbi:MAG: CRISPR-associated protein [Thermoproteaceae archaeon]|nr:CRISPR-associated protein [Thermoproteaceae archaeon]